MFTIFLCRVELRLENSQPTLTISPDLKENYDVMMECCTGKGTPPDSYSAELNRIYGGYLSVRRGIAIILGILFLRIVFKSALYPNGVDVLDVLDFRACFVGMSGSSVNTRGAQWVLLYTPCKEVEYLKYG